MLKIAHVSDVHLGAKLSYLGAKADEHRRKIKEAFRMSVEKAIESKVDVFLVAGDLFDNPFPSKVNQIFVLEQIKRLNDNGVYVLIITGNHDRADTGSVFSESILTQYHNPKFKIVAKEQQECWEIPELDLCINATGTEKQKNRNAPYSILEKSKNVTFNIGVYHGSVDIKGQPDNNPIYLKDLFASGFDYFALGDWHNMLNLTKGNTAIWYSGSPELIDSDQDNAGNMLLIELEKNKPAKVSNIKVGSVKSRVMLIDISSIKTIDDLITQIKSESDHSLMLIVTLSGIRSINFDLTVDSLNEALSENFYFLSFKDETKLKISEQDLLNYPDTMLIGKYIKSLMAQKTSDPKQNEIIDQAIQLGVTLLKGESDDFQKIDFKKLS